MKISVLDAQTMRFEGAVSAASLPATDGQVTIMDDHEPIFVVLGRGTIQLTPIAREKIEPIKIKRGMARMKRNELVVLVE